MYTLIAYHTQSTYTVRCADLAELVVWLEAWLPDAQRVECREDGEEPTAA